MKNPLEIEKVLYSDILPEMFKRVNAPVDNIKEFTQQDNWYWLYTWKKTDEIKFQMWLADYFKTNKKSFGLIGKSYLRNNNENRMRLSNEFTSQYGWKCSEDDVVYNPKKDK